MTKYFDFIKSYISTESLSVCDFELHGLRALIDSNKPKSWIKFIKL